MAKLDSTKPYSTGGAAVCVGYSCCADWLVCNEYLDIDVLPTHAMSMEGADLI